MSSTLLTSPSNKRPNSRSGSESPSSSVVTVKRIASSTARNGKRPHNSDFVSQSTKLAAAKPAASESRSKRRRSHTRPKSIVGLGDGIANFNRWSQSTGSSKSSATNHQRRSSFAKRLSGSFQSLGAYNPPSPTSTKNVLRKPNPSPNLPSQLPRSPGMAGMASQSSNISNPPISSRIPPAVTLPSLAHAVDAAPTPQNVDPNTPSTSELLPSATYMPGDGDYFGEAWAGTSPAKSKKVQKSPSNSLDVGSPPSQLAKAGANKSFASSPNPNESSPARERQPLPISKIKPRTGPLKNGEGLYQDSGAPEGEHPLPQERRSRHRKAPSQKAMLAKALEKANHAVVLDNAQNFESAMEAYEDACNLLHHVMMRTSGDDDKKKLEAIKNTYNARILELQSNELAVAQNFTDKALPDVPQPVMRNSIETFSPSSDEEADSGTMDHGETVRTFDETPPLARPLISRTLTREQLPPRRQSLMPRDHSSDGIRLEPSPVPRDREPLPLQKLNAMLTVPAQSNYVPPPLSPRRPASPAVPENKETDSHTPAPETTFHPGHVRHETAESTSWLDTIDESGGSSGSSVHSKTSLEGLRRKHIRTGSGDTEAEFDSALDAAIEAAYDEGYEPASDNEEIFNHDALGIEHERTEPISEARRNIDIAKQRVREAEREAAIANARGREKVRLIGVAHAPRTVRAQSMELDYDDEEAEEEERILEEMTRGYILEDLEDDGGTKSALPRQSDSSGFSGRTYGSSVGSMPATTGTGTPLSTVAETAMSHQLPNIIQKKPTSSNGLPPTAPPSHSTPSAPSTQPLQILKPSVSTSPSLSVITSPGVRERRLSGQKVKQLKIDTNAKMPNAMAGPKTQPLSKFGPSLSTSLADPPKSANIVRDGQVDPSASTLKPSLPSAGYLSTSPFPSSAENLLSGVSEATLKDQHQKDARAAPLSGSPVRQQGKSSTHGVLRKNFSSSSLKSLKQPLSTPPTTDGSPGTPLNRAFSTSATFQRNANVPVVPDLPTPSLANFAKAGVSAGTLSFFDSDIHSPHTPGSPNLASANAPLPLEPCPEPFLLRPFWLLRAIYQTLAHPRGGYISTRLFVPRDVWRVKNVKLKNVDEKVANCDLLTAALLKLAKADTLDADAVMEEMQAFEIVLDQVQVQLGKKLGADVGVQGTAAMFKASPNPDENGVSNDVLSSKSLNSGMGKSYLSSWRKLRAKNSVGPGLPSTGAGGHGKGTSGESLTLKSLPMTSMMNPRLPKRDPTKVLGIGPHANYMAALARLCDAVQVIDQIARQVEDPGLRHSSQTHVGLELSTRHASEFFAFFVCRFALNDIGMMLDKFVKRGSEWVLG